MLLCLLLIIPFECHHTHVQEVIPGIQSQIFYFFKIGPNVSQLAHDISFGNVGFTLLMARAYNEVFVCACVCVCVCVCDRLLMCEFNRQKFYFMLKISV